MKESELCVRRARTHKGTCCNIFIPCTRNNLLSTTLTFSQMPGRGAYLPLPRLGHSSPPSLAKLRPTVCLMNPPEPLEIINSLTVLGIGLNNSTEKKFNYVTLKKKKKAHSKYVRMWPVSPEGFRY